VVTLVDEVFDIIAGFLSELNPYALRHFLAGVFLTVSLLGTTFNPKRVFFTLFIPLVMKFSRFNAFP
jgi:hypothetical protein